LIQSSTPILSNIAASIHRLQLKLALLSILNAISLALSPFLRSSILACVTYEVGVFEHGQDDVRAVGGFTHVFVNRKVNRPAASGMPGEVRRGLQRLVKEEKPKL